MIAVHEVNAYSREAIVLHRLTRRIYRDDLRIELPPKVSPSLCSIQLAITSSGRVIGAARLVRSPKPGGGRLPMEEDGFSLERVISSFARSQGCHCELGRFVLTKRHRGHPEIERVVGALIRFARDVAKCSMLLWLAPVPQARLYKREAGRLGFHVDIHDDIVYRRPELYSRIKRNLVVSSGPL